jgi:predicted acetyltransferase
MIVPRETEWPDPTVRAIGVGGAITGARPTVLIKDDLVSLAAANSEVEMQTAIDWHIASRALMEEYEKDTGMEALEFIIGTRWAVWDLYEYVIQNDPTVETVIRAIVEDGTPIWPERFDDKRVAQLQREFGSMFWLLYMNSAANPELSDFNVEKVRHFEFSGSEITFDSTEDDYLLEEKWLKKPEGDGVKLPRGAPLNKHTWKHILGRGRGEFFRLRYG